MTPGRHQDIDQIAFVDPVLTIGSLFP